jgi:hypothetical protein
MFLNVFRYLLIKNATFRTLILRHHLLGLLDKAYFNLWAKEVEPLFVWKVRLAVSNGHSRLGFIISPDGGSRTSFRNVLCF